MDNLWGIVYAPFIALGFLSPDAFMNGMPSGQPYVVDPFTAYRLAVLGVLDHHHQLEDYTRSSCAICASVAVLLYIVILPLVSLLLFAIVRFWFRAWFFLSCIWSSWMSLKPKSSDDGHGEKIKKERFIKLGRDQVDALYDLVIRHFGKVTDVTPDIARMEGEVKKVEGDMNVSMQGHDNRLASLEKLMDDARNNDALKAEFNKVTKRLDDLETENEALRKQNQETESLVTVLGGRIGNLEITGIKKSNFESELEQLRESVVTKQSHNSLSSRFDVAEKSVEEIRASLKTTTENLAEQMEMIGGIKKGHESKSRQLAIYVNALDRKIKRVSWHAGQLVKNLKERYAVDLSELQRKLSVLDGKIEANSDMLKICTVHVDAAEDRMAGTLRLEIEKVQLEMVHQHSPLAPHNVAALLRLFNDQQSGAMTYIGDFIHHMQHKVGFIEQSAAAWVTRTQARVATLEYYGGHLETEADSMRRDIEAIVAYLFGEIPERQTGEGLERLLLPAFPTGDGRDTSEASSCVSETHNGTVSQPQLRNWLQRPTQNLHKTVLDQASKGADLRPRPNIRDSEGVKMRLEFGQRHIPP